MDYRTVRAKLKRPTERQKRASEALAEGKTITQAMSEAGYSEVTAAQGRRAVPAVVQALGVKASPLFQAGKGLVLGDLEALALGRLAVNVIEGRDGGTLSAKVIGSHKSLNLWTAELQQGIVILNAPGAVSAAPVSPELPPEDE